MKLFKKLSMAGALLLLVSLSVSSQALTVDRGFKTGSWADFGVLTLAPGSYALDLTAFTFGTAGPTVFGIANLAEAFQVSVASFGAGSTVFTTLGGTFNYIVGGNGGLGTVFTASINTAAVPLPASVVLLGSALAGMVGIGRRKLIRSA